MRLSFNFKNLKRNVITTWAFSYVIIICIMLIVITILAAIYTTATKKLSEEFNNYIFETVTDDVNNTLLSMNNLYVRINENENLKSMLYGNAELHSLTSTYNLIDDLRSYCQFAENTDEIFVYIKSKDMIVFSGGISPSSTYFKTYITPGTVSYEEWKTLLTDCTGISYNSMRYRTAANRDIETLSLVFPVSKTQNDCIGVILSDKTYFLKGLEEINWDELCDIYIYNKEGKLVTYSRHQEKSALPMTLAQISDHISDSSVAHTSEVVVNGHIWSIVTVTSAQNTKRSLFTVQLSVLLILIFSLIFLCFIVKNLLDKNYQPIKALLSSFNLDTKRNTNEYEKLLNSINNTLSENKKMTKEIDNQTKTIKKHKITKLLKGETLYLPQESTDLSFDGDFFAVLSFLLEDIGELFADDDNITDYERMQHLTFIIDNVISELMSEKDATVYTTEADSCVCCIICMKNRLPLDELNVLAYQGMDFINKFFSLSLTYALSEICQGIFNISIAYRQTAEVLEYKRLLGITEPLHYIKKETTAENSYIFNFDTEQMLVNAIKVGNHQLALSILSQIFNELSSQKDLPLDNIISIALDVSTTITKIAHDIPFQGADFNDNLVFYNKLKSGENLVNVYSMLSEYTVKLCEAVKSDIAEGKNRIYFLLSHIKKYIADNYTSPDLNVNSIGIHFNMNSQYVSSVFKKETGISLLDYINSLRIERALELIKDGKYSKKEIYKMVGFTTERTFYRVLKKYEETPQNN